MISNKCKRIWITTDWEVSPVLKEPGNLGRMCSLAKYLAKQNYEVVLWFTTYNHPEKQYLYDKDKCLQINKNETMVLLHSPIVYKRNTSPARVLYHSILAKKMKHMIADTNRFPVPDLIFCSYPTEQFCRVALDYGKKYNVPVIMDARDQWPDIFERAFPLALRPLARVLLLPMKNRSAYDFARASALCSMSPVNLQWALNYAGREKTDLDRCIFIGNKKENIDDIEMSSALDAWEKIGVSCETWNICIFTTLSKTAVDVDTVIEAVELAHQSRPQIRLIIGGRGDEEQRLKNRVAASPFIHMMGWMNQIQMSSVMSISKAGVLCYRNTVDFKDGWGNKVGQYLSYALPLLTSAKGFSKTYIEKYKCGHAYGEFDVKGLSDLLIQLMDNPAELEQLSQNAKDRYAADFEYGIVMLCFENMINDVYGAFNKRKTESCFGAF